MLIAVQGNDIAPVRLARHEIAVIRTRRTRAGLSNAAEWFQMNEQKVVHIEHSSEQHLLVLRHSQAHRFVIGVLLPQRLDADNASFILVDRPFAQVKEIDGDGGRDDLIHVRSESCITHTCD